MQQTYAVSANVYAGFWRRVAAYLIDSILLGIVLSIIGAPFGVFSTGSRAGGGLFFWYVLAIGGTWLYFALLESSSNQATLGKMALGIVATDLNGQRLTFGRASGRHFAKFISSAICGIGYLLAAFTERKQALHDMIASTLVTMKGASVAVSGTAYDPYGSTPPPPPPSYAPPPAAPPAYMPPPAAEPPAAEPPAAEAPPAPPAAEPAAEPPADSGPDSGPEEPPASPPPPPPV